MDSLRGFDDGGGWSAVAEDEPAIERPPAIGVDERRMHVRAYNYWVSLLDGRPYPSIEDLRPERIDDFGPHSVILDFSRDSEDPEVVFLGAALRAETGLDNGAERISDVPARSLLSRLTDHYLQIIANRAPIGFEAEFVSHRGLPTLYRGILMPLSTDGEEIDFIYGVINWKELADAQGLTGEVDRAVAAAPARADLPVWADGPTAELDEPGQDEEPRSDDRTLSLWPTAGDDQDDEPGADLPEDAALADRLQAARDGAEIARGADHRSRAALYRALGLAYDFALVAEARPDEYAELLEDSGLKVQPRAPMTPIVKLVFGVDYDKTRLTEFAAALSFARREGLGLGTLCAYLEQAAGGLKGVVAAERAARRPAARPDRDVQRRERLSRAPALAVIDEEIGQADPGEIVLLVGRADADGRIAIVAPLLRDEKLVASAIARTGVAD